MSEINVFDLSKLPKNELVAYFTDVMRMLSEEFVSVPNWAESFVDAYNALTNQLAVSEDDVNYLDIQSADQVADSAWVNLSQYLKIIIKHPDSEIAEAATRVKTIFDQIDNPTKLSYSVEYSELERLITALETYAVADMDRCGARPWFEVLKQSVTAFVTLYTAKIRENSARNLGENKAARQSSVIAYRSLVENANVVQRLSPTPALENFIAHVNELINRKRAVIKSRKTTKAAAKADPSDLS